MLIKIWRRSSMAGRTDRRRHPRFIKRLTAKFMVDYHNSTGISSDISENGIFIRTNKGLAPSSVITIHMIMPDNRVCVLTGLVIRTIKTPFPSIRNGMGIELLERDSTFTNFIKSLTA
jgi:hypothetical protein